MLELPHGVRGRGRAVGEPVVAAAVDALADAGVRALVLLAVAQVPGVADVLGSEEGDAALGLRGALAPVSPGAGLRAPEA
eukprot:14448204-Alexandrium_andersonii.AAC.1